MATRYQMPSDSKLVKAVARLGTITAVAEHFDIPRKRLSEHINADPKRAAKVRDARPLKVAGEGPLPDSPPVDHPERIKATQLEAEVKALRKDNKAYAKALAEQGQFFDQIVEATRVPVRKPSYKAHRITGSHPGQSVITPVFDQQFGQFVRPTDTPGNKGGFSVDVFDKRLERWVDGVTGIMGKRANGYRFEELIIPFGGDHVEGDEIFAGQAWQLALDPPRQVWELAERMDDAIARVIKFAKEELGVQHVALYGITGNHGKVGGKRGGARPATYNWDWLFLKILFDKLREQPVDEFAIEPGGALFFRCAGHEFQAIHGDQIRGWGGLPFYGLTKFDGRSIRLHSTIYRYLLMGHHHQPAEIPNGAGETIVSGDWVGANNLSGMMTAASRPQQKVIFVSDKWGVMGSERIYFTEAEEAYAQPAIHGRKA